MTGTHAVLMCLAGSLLATPAVRAQDAPANVANSASVGSTFVEITPEMQRAVKKGLIYLATQQQPDGSFGKDRYGRHVGVTALAGLAFMCNGDMPGRGLYAKNVREALKFILKSSDPGTGLIAADTSHGPMYGHGFATLFLAEVYGQDPRFNAGQGLNTREALVKAVRLIVRAQNKEGGWRYRPVSSDADLSVTICQVKALRAARNAGVKVPKSTIDRAIEYVKKCQNSSDGGFRYMLTYSSSSAFARSAAGVASLYYAGVYEDKALDRGLAYLMRFAPGTGRSSSSHYFYGHYYAVQAMFIAGGKYWQQWFPAIRKELLGRQTSDGSWSGQAGTAYGTAMALIILQMPNRYLPIFQK